MGWLLRRSLVNTGGDVPEVIASAIHSGTIYGSEVIVVVATTLGCCQWNPGSDRLRLRLCVLVVECNRVRAQCLVLSA